jgi:hypothetical protein
MILYVRCNLMPDSAWTLADFCQNLSVPEPMPLERLHCTLLYSTSDIAVPPPPCDFYPLPLQAIGCEVWEVANKPPHLVLLLDSDALHRRHAEFRRCGAAHPFPSYRPHISLSKSLPVGWTPGILPSLPRDLLLAGEDVFRW